jgi:ABC-type antimicrobial peptide transport system permease subunit
MQEYIIMVFECLIIFVGAFLIGFFFVFILIAAVEAGYSITEVCPHDVAYTKVISTACGCETTAEICEDCGEQLTDPKTNC